MRYLRRLVKIEPHTVSHKLPDDRATLTFSILLYGPPDISDGIVRFHRRHPSFEALAGYRNDFFSFGSGRADKKGFIGVGIIAV